MTREEAGVSLGEASKDLEIKEVILENIEDGNIGCFKDIFVLKDYIYDYAKYLGINPDKVIDEFNEYMFEYTSKIPVKEIERLIKEQNTTEPKKEIASPYTVSRKKHNKNTYIIIYSVVIFLLIITVFWCVKQIVINQETARVISYVK
jgi:cytoskeletal protein RodZ